MINIDECVIRYTDHRKRGWVRKYSKNQVTTTRHLNGVNVVAALCSTGQLLYSVNHGKTNSHTFKFFLLKLCSHLDGENVHWRKHTVIMLDNATYHRS